MADAWQSAQSLPLALRPNLLIGCGAGFSGDRTDVARAVVDTLVASGQPSVLMFETLAERTLALAQLAKDKDPSQGYEPLLEEMLAPVLADCLTHGVRIVSNFGAANPAGAARCIQQLAARLGARAPRVAVVWGDDVLTAQHRPLLEQACDKGWPTAPVVSANAYIGAQPIAQALHAGADIVVTGRVADPSLALGPAAAYYGWAWNDWGAGQSQVCLPAEHGLAAGRVEHVSDQDLDMRLLLRKVFEDMGQPMCRQRRQQSHADFGRLQGGNAAQRVQRSVHVCQKPLGLGPEIQTGLRDVNTACAAFKQLYPHPVFQALNQRAECGL